MEKPMNRWKQRPAHTPLPDSPTEEYRYCLDGLIATIEDMRSCELMLDLGDWSRYDDMIDAAEERAADLAHRLFERWIEVAPENDRVLVVGEPTALGLLRACRGLSYEQILAVNSLPKETP
jgi:hypothetical protein